jgi:hypothetical protein
MFSPLVQWCRKNVKVQFSPFFAGLLAMQVLAVWQELLSFSHLYRQLIVTDDESVCHCFWRFRQRKKTVLNLLICDVLYKCILCVKSINVLCTFKLYSIVYSKMYSITLREFSIVVLPISLKCLLFKLLCIKKYTVTITKTNYKYSNWGAFFRKESYFLSFEPSIVVMSSWNVSVDCRQLQ